MHHDIFNGDADGLCSVLQLRLAHPIPDAVRITGTKRDTLLLAQVPHLHGSSITVFDISLDRNRTFLLQLLHQGNRIEYIDHHYAGEIPRSPLLTACIDPRPDTCTSLLVNALVDGKYGKWAVCGAFGDNLHLPARRLAEDLGLSEDQIRQLQETGELLNYNSYGETVDDLHIAPLVLYADLAQFDDPLDFFAQSPLLPRLRQGFQADLEQALQIKEHGLPSKNRVYFFPDTAWARRVSGVFANRKATEKAAAAHALITSNRDGSWRISVRAPLNDCRNADTLCRKFPTGGGRAGAAGVTNLPYGMLDSFLADFQRMYQ
ncbi:MAG TPA: acetyltransferase [Desulfoprunum sp.]|nr:acetyltransferase [Desulfoprunum sp.]